MSFETSMARLDEITARMDNKARHRAECFSAQVLIDGSGLGTEEVG